MVQSTDARDSAAQRHPDERWRALCPPAFVAQFLAYDHHVIWLAGRPAVMLTYPWHELDLTAPLLALPFDVSFSFAAGHPLAPPELQAVARTLEWHPVEAPRATQQNRKQEASHE